MKKTSAIPSLGSLLSSGEWNDAEFKEAHNALPKSAFETVSAFANTHGGWLVLGIKQDGERFQICDVDDPTRRTHQSNATLSTYGIGESHTPTLDVGQQG